MNLKEIKELIKLIDDSGLTEFHYEKEDLKLTIKKEIKIQAVEAVQVQSSIRQTVSPEQESIEEDIKIEDEIHIIKSPIVGVYYSSPNPEAPALVKIGDRIKVGQVLCIVEAMKLMNEITSEVDGEIVDILINNQGAVEYGQPLFKIRKA